MKLFGMIWNKKICVSSQPRLGTLQKTIQDMCKFKNSGFPGGQPVSMDLNNIHLLSQKPYRVSWKADGSRYMMLILKENEVYFFDRDNSVFQVSGMRFPWREDIKKHIYDTLIDGEMVIDKVNGLSIPRYLVYDIICFNGTSYMEYEFFSEQLYSRLKCIKENIIGKFKRILMTHTTFPLAKSLLGFFLYPFQNHAIMP